MQGVFLSTMAITGIYKAFPFNAALSSQKNVTDAAVADMKRWGKYGDMSHTVLLWNVRPKR